MSVAASGDEEKKRRALKKCTVELCRDMNPEDLKRALFAKNLLTSNELERLSLPIMTTKEKNLFILMKIPSKGPGAFDSFVEALQATSEENPSHDELVHLLRYALNTS